MSQHPGADVIVTADRDPPAVEPWVQFLLAHGGPHLRRLIVIDDESSDPGTAPMLERLDDIDPRILVLRNSHRLGVVGAYNRGLNERLGDAVLVSSDCIASSHWLGELAAVAHSEQRTACAGPLTNGRGTCSVPATVVATLSNDIDLAGVHDACTGLPRWTAAPSLAGSCIYLRGDVVDAVGLLDIKLMSLEAAINDWIRRASLLGFGAKRANHIYVHRGQLHGERDRDRASREERLAGDGSGSFHPGHQLDRFEKSLGGQVAAHAVRVQATGKLRVAYDIRHLPREQVGTRTYAVCLGQCLGKIPNIELTLLVREPSQAEGLRGRVVTPDQWRDDVEVIHKPAQVSAPQELKLLFESSAHIVVTYQDLIGYQIPSAVGTDWQHDRYCGTGSLSMQAVQRVIAYSESARQEIMAEFGIPADEVCVTPLGVDAVWFGHRELSDIKTFHNLGLATPYFFSIATDFPHKNLPNLLDAYAMLRSRWQGERPPSLVLAGHTSGARTNFYPNLESKALPTGVTFLGPVSRDQLRVLYQRALALVFPSLYEGFGLPPLEAMAAGTPVIAMPVSAIPEVGGDAVLYADGLSVRALARALESVGTDPALRDLLRERGRKRVVAFRWEKTALATVEVYRSAVFRPSRRSLQARRLLRDAIVHWSDQRRIGIKNAVEALNVSLHSRLRRDRAFLLRAFGRRRGGGRALPPPWDGGPREVATRASETLSGLMDPGFSGKEAT